MIKILHVYPKMNNAGTEKVMIDILNNIDKSKYKIDFLVSESGYWDQYVESLGSVIHRVKSYNIDIKKLNDFFEQYRNYYDIVHVHSQNNIGKILKSAKKNGIKNTIAHSHASRDNKKVLIKLYKFLKTREVEKYADFFLSCSKAAAEWFFPTKNKKTIIYMNPIDLDNMEYNNDYRSNIRKKYGIKREDKVIVTVGRISKEKNYKLIIKIIKEIAQKKSDFRFLFLGDGSGKYKKQIQNLIIRNKLEKNILMLGNQKKVNEFLCASDLFLLPSKHEGLGIAMVEAQANGLIVFTSDKVPAEVDTGVGLVEHFSLKLSAKEIANNIIEKVENNINNENRLKYKELLSGTNYDVKNGIKIIENLYDEICRKNVGIITITKGINYGNRLQNYALQETIKKCGYIPTTIKIDSWPIKYKIKLLVKKIINFISSGFIVIKREGATEKFNEKYVKMSKLIIGEDYSNINAYFDYFVAGSDQIWNSQFKDNNKSHFLQFSEYEKNIAYAPSFGMDHIVENRKEEYKEYLKKVKFISVRESSGQKIIEDLINRKVPVVLDPTLLLSREEWLSLEQKPNNIGNEEKFVIVYFLGNIEKKLFSNIEEFAKKRKLRIIFLNNKRYPQFYMYGPSEFLWLFNNSELVLTDSFHACSFSLIFKKPFFVFERNSNNMMSMNSRIYNFINLFHLSDRLKDGDVNLENYNINDYEKAYKILLKEQKKSIKFLKKALDIKE